MLTLSSHLEKGVNKWINPDLLTKFDSVDVGLPPGI